jgi:pilus assembly protein Flp/PilA
VRNFLKDESGASLAEYALLLTIGSIALVGAIQGLRGSVVGAFSTATDLLVGIGK